MEYKINENKVSAARYESYAMELYLAQWWWIYLLPVIGCLCLSAFNINFIYVAVILLFIVASLVLSFVYIYYILVEESRYSTLQKSVEIGENGIKLDYGSDAEDNTPQTFLGWDSFNDVKVKRDGVLLIFRHRKYCFFVLPYSAFSDKEQLRAVMIYIYSKIRQR